MDSATKVVAKELPGLVKLYTDGSVERLWGSPYAPPSPEPDPLNGVASKDVTISQDPPVSARLFLPTLANPNQRLPVLVYYHGGAFCVESAFSTITRRYLEILVSKAKVMAVSVEYRLAPEHLLPIAYEDSWAALQWVASHSLQNQQEKDGWLLNHADFDKLILGGESAGANIVHNMAMIAGAEGLVGGVKIYGVFLGHPYFWGSERIGAEPVAGPETSFGDLVWEFCYPTAENGLDNEMLNPVGEGKRSLKGIGCLKMLVHVAEKDMLRDRGIWFCEAVRESGWEGQLELLEVEGGYHGFHLFELDQSENGRIVAGKLVSFLAG